MTKQTNKLRTCFSETRLGSKFKIKDSLAKEHKRGIVYKVECQSERGKANYVGEKSKKIFSEQRSIRVKIET